MQSREDIISLVEGSGQLIAAAIHNGHDVRPEIAEFFAISEEKRMREEDPYTALFTEISDTRIVAKTSRFEVDLNRPRNNAVYRGPENAWGIDVWKEFPPNAVIERSLEKYDKFYTAARAVILSKIQKFGRVLVFDLHSYNHRRNGPDSPPADPKSNPEVNVGTGTLDRGKWAPVADKFIRELRSHNFMDRNLDVRENVKFKGGYFSKWIHETFPESACALALEFKKFFMDEWTGKPDREVIESIKNALRAVVPNVLEVFNNC